MSLNVRAVQQALRQDGLDGWLLYDFRGLNPIAARVAGIGHDVIVTRRWYYLIPATGEPRALVHAIERQSFEALPGIAQTYARREELAAGLGTLVAGCSRVAMEYSPDGAIPYISRVDGGTLEAIRRLGVEVVSSGDLVQRFEALWDQEALTTHREAAARLYRIKDRAFEVIARRTRDRVPMTEFDVQQLMASWFRDEGLVSDSNPVVAVQENAGNPHYLPTADRHRPIRPDELVLLDLWGKQQLSGAVFADITWVGYTGTGAPEAMTRAFAAVCMARDAALTLVQAAASERRELRGWEVDQVARERLEQAATGGRILHRTGHSLGEDVHGNGTHLDDYETHDDRRLMPGTGFTIEPGLYFETFGVRTEINVFLNEEEAVVSGPIQREILMLT